MRTPRGLPTPGSRRQDSDAITCVLLCQSFCSLGVARTGLRRGRNQGLWSTATYVYDRPFRPSWPCSPSSRTFRCRNYGCTSSCYTIYDSEKHLSPPPALSWIFFGCHAPFYPDGATVQCEHCCPYADATRRWDLSTRTSSGDGERIEGWATTGHEELLAKAHRWRSTSVNCGSCCFSREHGPRRTAAAESLWRPRGVTGSA